MSHPREHWEQLIRDYFRAVDEERIEDVVACFAPGGSIHFAFMDAPAVGHDALRALFIAHIGRFREHADVVTRILVQGDTAISEITFEGVTHEGRPVHLENCNVYSFADGRFDRVTVYLDTVAMATQLGQR